MTVEQHAEADSEKRSFDIPILIIALVAIAAMAGWFFFGSDDQVIEDVSVTEIEVTEEQQVLEAVAADTPDSELLSRARLAAESGMLVEPAGTNALYYYSLFLEQQPDDDSVASEIELLVDRIAANADQAVVAGDYRQAAFLIDQIRNAGLSHPALTDFPVRIQEIAASTRELALAAAQRGDEAAANRSLASFEALPGIDAEALLTLRSEVRDALSAKRLADAAAEQERRARAAQAAAERQSAAASTEQANGSSPSAAASRASADAPLADERAAERINEALANGDYSTAVSTWLALPESDANKASLRGLLSAQLASSVTGLADAGQLADAEAALASWRAVTGDPSAEATLQSAIDQAYIKSAVAETVSAGTLRRVRALAPVYPRMAIRRNLSGRLKVEFTILEDGSTSDIEVVETVYDGIFDRSAIRAVSGWQYEPRQVRNQTVAQRVYAFVDYNLE